MLSFARKIAIAGAAALALVGSLAATAGTADARPYHRYGGGWGWFGPAFVGGLALGTFAARPYYYGGPYYARPVYGPRCWVEPRQVVTPHGFVRVRHVRVCG